MGPFSGVTLLIGHVRSALKDFIVDLDIGPGGPIR
jgi:hypothetical protein